VGAQRELAKIAETPASRLPERRRLPLLFFLAMFLVPARAPLPVAGRPCGIAPRVRGLAAPASSPALAQATRPDEAPQWVGTRRFLVEAG